MSLNHTSAEVSLLFNCLLILALNDMTTNHGKMALADLQTGLVLAFSRFVELLKVTYKYIPRKESITDDVLLTKVQYLRILNCYLY